MTTDEREPWSRFWLKGLIGGTIGAAMGAGGVLLLERDLIRFDDYLPVILSVLYLLLGLTVWVNPYVLKTAVPGERLWLRSVVGVASAVALAAPALVPSAVDPWMAFVLIAVFYACGGLISHIMVKRLDELTRSVMADTNQMAAQLIVPGIFLYGAVERLGLMPTGVSIWLLNGVVAWTYFIIAQFAWMRRGVDNPLAVGK